MKRLTFQFRHENTFRTFPARISCTLVLAYLFTVALISRCWSASDPSLGVTTNVVGRLQVTWKGDSDYSSQLEHSPNLSDWFRLDLPAQEANAIMAMEIPAYLLGDRRQFFRLDRSKLANTPIPATPGFNTNLVFVHGGIARKYFLKIPAGWSNARTWPLAFVLPGHGQSIVEFASNQRELLQVADNRGFIIVFAEATAGIDSYAWFASNNPNLTQPYIDDAAFLLALVEHLKSSGLRVNPDRIYASGFSNGGSMVHYLAGKTNHPFAAFAIMESGTAGFCHFREPYNRDNPDSGSSVPAVVPSPSRPRPVLLMNMVTSVPWTFEGRASSNAFTLRGARHNVARWTAANGFGDVPQAAPQPPLPPFTPYTTNSTWSATGDRRARVAHEDIRPDHNWPAGLIAAGWSEKNAARFPYVAEAGGTPTDQRLPESLRQAYPHKISEDPALPARYARVDSGTMTVEFWRSSLNNRTNEVIFVGLSDGGHQWPNSDDNLPFDANVEVLRFFDAHP